MFHPCALPPACYRDAEGICGSSRLFVFLFGGSVLLHISYRLVSLFPLSVAFVSVCGCRPIVMVSES